MREDGSLKPYKNGDNSNRAGLIIQMEDFGAVKTVEFGRRSGTVCSYIFREKAVANFKIARQLFRNGNFVETVAGRPDNGTNFFFALPKCAEIGNPVVVNNP
jgi:uncharacterized protein YrrD